MIDLPIVLLLLLPGISFAGIGAWLAAGNEWKLRNPGRIAVSCSATTALAALVLLAGRFLDDWPARTIPLGGWLQQTGGFALSLPIELAADALQLLTIAGIATAFAVAGSARFAPAEQYNATANLDHATFDLWCSVAMLMVVLSALTANLHVLAAGWSLAAIAAWCCCASPALQSVPAPGPSAFVAGQGIAIALLTAGACIGLAEENVASLDAGPAISGTSLMLLLMAAILQSGMLPVLGGTTARNDDTPRQMIVLRLALGSLGMLLLFRLGRPIALETSARWVCLLAGAILASGGALSTLRAGQASAALMWIHVALQGTLLLSLGVGSAAASLAGNCLWVFTLLLLPAMWFQADDAPRPLRLPARLAVLAAAFAGLCSGCCGQNALLAALEAEIASGGGNPSLRWALLAAYGALWLNLVLVSAAFVAKVGRSSGNWSRPAGWGTHLLLLLPAAIGFCAAIFGLLSPQLIGNLAEVGVPQYATMLSAGAGTLAALFGAACGWLFGTRRVLLPAWLHRCSEWIPDGEQLERMLLRCAAGAVRAAAVLVKAIEWIVLDLAAGHGVRAVRDLTGALFRPLHNGLVQFYCLSAVLSLAALCYALLRWTV